MVGTILAVLALLVVIGLASLVRAKRILTRLDQEIAKSWQEVLSALNARIEALEELALALRSAGYVPEGVGKLREALDLLRKSTDDPRSLAEADERVEAVLRGIYRALPRERDERVRQAQNRLAAADEELDILKHRYNELVLNWRELACGLAYRVLLPRRKAPEPLVVSDKEEELFRRYLPNV